MSMHSSLFRKPVYKKVNFITLLIAVSCVILIFFSLAGWYILASVIILWTAFSAWASYNISSGVYISALCRLPVKEKLLCITFDDGPCGNTEAILKILEKHNAKATFFISGSKVQGRETIISQLNKNGHEIGNHSYSHKAYFPLMKPAKIKTEIRKTQEIIQNITGKAPIYFRPPYGVSNPLIAKALKSFDLKTIGWSIRSMDTTNRKPEKIINKIINKIQSGDIILLHDTSKHIRPILEQLLVYCKQNQYRLVNINELIKNKA